MIYSSAPDVCKECDKAGAIRIESDDIEELLDGVEVKLRLMDYYGLGIAEHSEITRFALVAGDLENESNLETIMTIMPMPDQSVYVILPYDSKDKVPELIRHMNTNLEKSNVFFEDIPHPPALHNYRLLRKGAEYHSVNPDVVRSGRIPDSLANLVVSEDDDHISLGIRPNIEVLDTKIGDHLIDIRRQDLRTFLAHLLHSAITETIPASAYSQPSVDSQAFDNILGPLHQK